MNKANQSFVRDDPALSTSKSTTPEGLDIEDLIKRFKKPVWTMKGVSTELMGFHEF
jgi:hypothetical protein